MSNFDNALVEAKAAEWNERYAQLGREVKLKDLGPSAYEETVGYELLDVCGEDAGLALAVFNHADNSGGWMVGDVAGFLKKRQ